MAKGNVVQFLVVLAAIVTIAEGFLTLYPLSFPGSLLGTACLGLGTLLLGMVFFPTTRPHLKAGHWVILISVGVVIYILGMVFGALVMLLTGFSIIIIFILALIIAFSSYE